MAEVMVDRVPCHEVKIQSNGVAKVMKVPVVQELIQKCDSVFPERFTRAMQDDSPPTTLPAPVIDLAKFQAGADPAEREAELQKLRRVSKEWGMFLVENHGIHPEVLEEFKTVVKEFFRLSYEEKKASVGSYAHQANTGYGRNYVKETQAYDWHDRLSMKPFPEDATNGLSVWPTNPPNFRGAAENYVSSSRKMCDTLLEALAESLSEDKNTFLKFFDEKRSEFHVKINCYPPCPRPDLALGIAPHSDGSALTVLTQFESSGGLQAYNNRDKNWATIEWPVGGILINVGDLLQIMSNGEFESPWHRVLAQEVERYSVAAFYTPPIKAEIGPYTDPEKSSYRKLTVDDYINNFYKVNPTPTKQAIEYAQIKIDDIPADIAADIPADIPAITPADIPAEVIPADIPAAVN